MCFKSLRQRTEKFYTLLLLDSSDLGECSITPSTVLEAPKTSTSSSSQTLSDNSSSCQAETSYSKKNGFPRNQLQLRTGLILWLLITFFHAETIPLAKVYSKSCFPFIQVRHHVRSQKPMF